MLAEAIYRLFAEAGITAKRNMVIVQANWQMKKWYQAIPFRSHYGLSASFSRLLSSPKRYFLDVLSW